MSSAGRRQRPSPADQAAGERPASSRRESIRVRVRALLRAINSDDEQITQAFQRLTGSHRAFAPLAFTVGAFALLMQGLRLLVVNWRLLLIQIPPAAWIWLAMFDLKLHVLHGRSFNAIRGPVLIPLAIAIVAITAGGFYLNAVFAFAIDGPPPPRLRPAFAKARTNTRPILVPGAIVGLALALATLVGPRWERPWFTLLLGVVVGVMMLCYIAIPARLIGVKSTAPPRDRLATSLLSSALGVTVCTPPYVLGRIGLLMLGSKVLLVPGIIVLLVGVALTAGATGAVRAIKLSAALTAGKPADGAASGEAAGAGPAGGEPRP